MDNNKMFECNDDDFMVRGRDEGEILKIARMHTKEKHHEDFSDEELKVKIKEV